MNQEIKKLWVEALRSGDYTQTTGCLKDNHGFCCLGVLTDLYIKEKGLHWELNETSDPKDPTYQLYQESSYLPTAVQAWAELKSNAPNVKARDPYEAQPRYFNLTRLNDHYTYNFNEIANLIEKQL